MLINNIKTLLLAKGIKKPFVWLTNLGISRGVASRLINNKAEKIDISHIEKICLYAFCTPNDIFSWTPDEVSKTAEGKIKVNDANVLAAVRASNGMVYIVDAVLLPPQNSYYTIR